MRKKVLIIAIVVLLFILVAPAWYFSSQLLFPTVKPCPKDHFIFCGDPSERGLPFREVSFTSKDGIRLSGWLVPAASKKAVIMVHGIGASRNEGMRWAKALHDAGLNVLLFDLRNGGKSGKAVTGMGMYEKEDVRAALDYLLRAEKMNSVGVFGVSMGAASGIPAMAEDGRIAAGVFEAGYADLWDLLSVMIVRDYHLPKFPLLHMTALMFRLRGGISMAEVSPEKYIDDIAPRPVFVIHCKDDHFIPYENGERLYKAAKEPKEFYTAACKIHAQAWQSDGKMLEKRIAGFFLKNLK
ncbi:MAG TPA: alpha/beta hydrolase [Spirochaetes bacterium]|nr:alpha/beta hydrolase [Spirochaetota bacterium]